MSRCTLQAACASVWATSLVLLAANLSLAETVIKLDLGSDSVSDIEMVSGLLTTSNNGNASSAGYQDTSVKFLSFLDGVETDIGDDGASFTLSGVTLTGTPDVIGGMILIQPTSGGTFELYDGDNNLLLSGALLDGTLSGPLGGAGTGGFLAATFGDFTGGSLASHFAADSMSLAIGLTNVMSINSQSGLRLNNNQLIDFTADGTASIAGLVPEPAAGSAALLGLLCAVPWLRRRVGAGVQAIACRCDSPSVIPHNR